MRNSVRNVLLSLMTTAVLSAATWQIDPSHTSAQFAVRHMMVSTVRGEFSGVRGTAEFDPADPSQAKLDVTIDATTLNSREPKRDADLKSPNFFEVEKYPTIAFRSKRVEAAGSGKLKITGDLTMHGVTREVVLDVEGPSPELNMRGMARIGAMATTKLNRKDFGMNWNRALDSGGVVVGDEVTVTLDVELTRRTAPPAPPAKN